MTWVLAAGLLPASAAGLTPDSPEVKAAVQQAIHFLESDAADDGRLGARALVGLALLKNGADANHPQVVRAVEAIQRALGPRDAARLNLDLYSTGLSIIFLVTLDASKYRPEIECLLDYLKLAQKAHGGWGYRDRPTGDTSMTQYAVLSCWEAVQEGYVVPRESIEAVTLWLLKTQDPSGGFGYQGNPSETSALLAQKEVKPSMTAAGLGSLYICADLLGLVRLADPRGSGLPAALREVKPKQEEPKEEAEPPPKVDRRLIQQAQARGIRWMRANYDIAPKGYTHYYLYALERYSSFREAAEGKFERQPKWYDDGARMLIRTQAADGSWQSKCGATVDTAFGALFLLRSTKKSIEKARGVASGRLVVGRGLPASTGAVELRMGRVVPQRKAGPAAELVALLEGPMRADFETGLDALAELPLREAEELVARHAERLRQLAAHPAPAARAGAIRALGLVRNLDHAPLLIGALADADPRVAAEARDALSKLSRRPLEPPVPDQDAETRRRAEIEYWKAWYQAVRPEAEFDQ